MNMNGLMAGLGQGLQAAGAMQWEKAKQDRLEAIRKQERTERREDARLDREARMEDAKELETWKQENAPKMTDVLDEDGNIIGQRGPNNSFTPIANPDQKEAARVYADAVKQVQDAFSRYGDINTMPDSIRDAVMRGQRIIEVYQNNVFPGGADGPQGDPGGNKDDIIGAALGDLSGGGGGSPPPTSRFTPDPVGASGVLQGLQDAQRFNPRGGLLWGDENAQPGKPDWMRVF